VKKYPSLAHALHAIGEALKRSSALARERAQQEAMNFANVGWHEMVLSVYTYTSQMLANEGLMSDALEMSQAGYAYYVKNGSRDNNFLAGQLLSQLIQCLINLGNDERAAQFLGEVTALSAKTTFHVHDIVALARISTSFNRLGRVEDARKYSYTAYQLAKSTGYLYGLAMSANSVSMAFATGQSPDEVNNMIAFGEEAMTLSMQHDFQGLLGAVEGNLAIAYWKLRTKEGQAKSIQVIGTLARYYKERKQFADASLTLNNAGSMFFLTEQYEYASNLFQESIQLGRESVEGVGIQDRLTFYQSQMSAYEFLTACYAKLRDAEKAFDALEGSRSRVLAERLSRNGQINQASLEELRSLLAPDEACIMYSLFSGYEVIILVVTKTDAQVIFHANEEFIGSIKQKYGDRINRENRERRGTGNEDDQSGVRVQASDFNKVTQLTRKFMEKPGLAEEMLDEYLRGYYSFLIQPIAPKLAGINKLLISPDNVLNYIPFEALKDSKGKYLIEGFDVRYAQSVGVLRNIAARKYAPTRKSILAMGGAQFQNMKATPAPLQTQQDLNALLIDVDEKDRLGESQRTAYASVFGTKPMTFLPGTVEEVNRIRSLVPTSEIVTGALMTENKLKELSRSGRLKEFKVLHLATHGFVVSEIPLLSGVAMSIFEEEQGGEDGFVNVHEMAALQLNADLAILSACQTALGKIYAGEGVTGLTQSLLVAGANAALVSLWPVNDHSTMLFMDDFYRQWTTGQASPAVVSEIKRKFIRGEFGQGYTHPAYWAPFIYYGK
jgi:CHAT domain-containing protein